MHVGCACLSLVRSGADRALKQWSTIELPKYASHFWLGTHINREIEPCAIDEGKAAHGPTLAAGHSRVPLYSASLTCSLTHSLALFVCHTQAKSWWCWRSSWRSTQSGATEDLRNCLSWRAESRSRRRRRRSKRSLSEGSAHLLGTDCVCVCVCVYFVLSWVWGTSEGCRQWLHLCPCLCPYSCPRHRPVPLCD